MSETELATKTESDSTTGVKSQVDVSPWRCWLGSIIAGSLAYSLYLLTSAIAQAFATKAIPTQNMATMKIAIAVRTLVVGMATLGTGVFGIAALGLAALGIQMAIQRVFKKSTPKTS